MAFIATVAPASAASLNITKASSGATVRIVTPRTGEPGAMDGAVLTYATARGQATYRFHAAQDQDLGEIGSPKQIELVAVPGQPGPLVILAPVACPGRDCFEPTQILRFDARKKRLLPLDWSPIGDAPPDGARQTAMFTIVRSIHLHDADSQSDIPIRDKSTIRYYYAIDASGVGHVFATNTVYQFGSDTPQDTPLPKEASTLGCFRVFDDRRTTAIPCAAGTQIRTSLSDDDFSDTRVRVEAFSKTAGSSVSYVRTIVKFTPVRPGSFTPAQFPLSAPELRAVETRALDQSGKYPDVWVAQYADESKKQLVDFDYYTFRPELRAYHQVRRFHRATAAGAGPFSLIALDASNTITDTNDHALIYRVTDKAGHVYLMNLDFADAKQRAASEAPFHIGGCLVVDAHNGAREIEAGDSAGGLTCPK